jgi:GNAT superfamily N-acetyltransferase
MRYAATMASNIIVRGAQAGDLPVLGKLGALLVRTHHGFDAQRFMAPEAGVEEGYAWFLGRELENPEAVVLVAELVQEGAEPEVIGYTYAGIEPRSWKELRDRAGFIHDVVVASHVRAQGVGTRLVEAAGEWLTTNGAPRVMLWTAEKNPGAQRLFARLGFRRTMIEMTREA